MKSTKTTISKSELANLKAAFAKNCKSYVSRKDAVVDVGIELKKAGVSRPELIKLAMTVVSESYAHTIVSLFWANKSASSRKGVAGRSVSPDAKALLAYAVKKYGKRAQSLLLAASRLAAKQAK